MCHDVLLQRVDKSIILCGDRTIRLLSMLLSKDRFREQQSVESSNIAWFRRGKKPSVTLDSILQYNHQRGSLLPVSVAGLQSPIALKVKPPFLSSSRPTSCVTFIKFDPIMMSPLSVSEHGGMLNHTYPAKAHYQYKKSADVRTVSRRSQEYIRDILA